MQVSEVMTRTVEMVGPNDSIQQAAKAMARIDVGVLAVAEGDRLVGMITDRDIAVRAVAEGRDPARTLVKDVMSAEVKYCYDDDAVTDVADNMAEQQLRRLPVVTREKRLVGIISLADIAREREPNAAGQALQGIARPGGLHTQQQS
jgi:CBS domain-containing protein